MSLLEFDEFSSPQKLVDFVKNHSFEDFINSNIDEIPEVEYDEDIYIKFYTFQKYSFEYHKNDHKNPTLIFFIKNNFVNQIFLFDFIQNNTKIQNIIDKLGEPDFRRSELEPFLLDEQPKMIKYYYDEYSIAFDYDDESVIRVSVFEDEYR
jgi:hypothetical protein